MQKTYAKVLFERMVFARLVIIYVPYVTIYLTLMRSHSYFILRRLVVLSLYYIMKTKKKKTKINCNIR